MERSQIYTILKATAQAYKDFQRSFRYGVLTEDLLLNFKDSLAESLGEYEIIYDYIWGKDTLNIDGETKGYIPQIGDTLIMDVSVGKSGVWCDVCRTYFVHEISENQRNTFEMIKTSLKKGSLVLKSGLKACAVYNAVNSVYQQNGKILIHHAGHKIGKKPLMQPQFLKNKQTILNSGLYTIESGLYEGFGIRLENDFIVDENGAIDLFEDLLPLEIEEYVLDE